MKVPAVSDHKAFSIYILALLCSTCIPTKRRAIQKSLANTESGHQLHTGSQEMLQILSLDIFQPELMTLCTQKTTKYDILAYCETNRPIAASLEYRREKMCSLVRDERRLDVLSGVNGVRRLMTSHYGSHLPGSPRGQRRPCSEDSHCLVLTTNRK